MNENMDGWVDGVGVGVGCSSRGRRGRRFHVRPLLCRGPLASPRLKIVLGDTQQCGVVLPVSPHHRYNFLPPVNAVKRRIHHE